MRADEFKKQLRDILFSFKYKGITDRRIPESWLVMKKGWHIFACVPFSEVESNDYRNKSVKSVLRKVFHALPVAMEKAAFILYYGSRTGWDNCSEKFKADKTAMRPIIVQAVQFFDTETGENVIERSSWGPMTFGFWGSTIDCIEQIGDTIKRNVAQ